MQVGILTPYESDAAIIASWLQLDYMEWRHVDAESYFFCFPQELILATAAGILRLKPEVVTHLRNSCRLLELPDPVDRAYKVTVCSILSLAHQEMIELTLEEAHRFTAAGFVALLGNE